MIFEDGATYVSRWGGFDQTDDGMKNARLITREGAPGAVKPAVFQDSRSNEMNGGTPNPRYRGWDVKRTVSRSKTPRRGSPHTFNVPKGLVELQKSLPAGAMTRIAGKTGANPKHLTFHSRTHAGQAEGQVHRQMSGSHLRPSTGVNEHTKDYGQGLLGLGSGAYVGTARTSNFYAGIPRSRAGTVGPQQGYMPSRGKMYAYDTKGAAPDAASKYGPTAKPGDVKAEGEGVFRDPSKLGKPVHSQNVNRSTDKRLWDGRNVDFEDAQAARKKAATPVSSLSAADRRARLNRVRARRGMPSKPSLRGPGPSGPMPEIRL